MSQQEPQTLPSRLQADCLNGNVSVLYIYIYTRDLTSCVVVGINHTAIWRDMHGTCSRGREGIMVPLVPLLQTSVHADKPSNPTPVVTGSTEGTDEQINSKHAMYRCMYCSTICSSSNSIFKRNQSNMRKPGLSRSILGETQACQSLYNY